MKRLKQVFPLLVLALGLLTGCTTVSETGRKQIMLVTPAQETQM
jgi:hypothetical protein